jgi:uncharacterized membrane protein
MNIWLITERLALTIWVGGMLVVGYIVVPVLFRTLEDRMLAGDIAGQLFSILSKVGLGCGLILLSVAIVRSSGDWYRVWQIWILLAMMSIILIGEYGLTPAMQAIKQSAGVALEKGTEAYQQFARLHGFSSVLFLVNSLLGIVLAIYGAVNRSG